MRVVFDTNVFLSGLLFKGGIPSRLLDLAFDRRFDLYLSPEIVEEIRNVLEFKFELTLHERDQLIRWLGSFSSVVYPKEKLRLVQADDPDNRILECALEAKAHFLVTGDKKHLLPLRHPFSFKIVSPAQFYQIYQGETHDSHQ